ncbi:hypothetical protein K461DRAFT_268548 [Myriangium duriaei CBS 260.36]|uniref:Chitin synthesis regulation, Congo red resistance, RCR protein n=1 Tax=Myriangium duriaei CBS 260.36 TaxID=1168546 RepID=A0A9P4MMD8_9PEZI|nr:hypothetical protein K461DRAFT_268548 [Myriangium duriaei CBS 260.36]
MYINTLAKRGTDMLSKRYYCDSYGYCYNSGWSSWGRWVVFAICVGGALVLFFLFSCITARRRRRAGMQPFRGTGWAAGGPPGHGAATYNPNYRMQQQPPYNPGDPTQQPYYNNNQPPPAYHTPQNAGYYGGDAGIQQPPAAYKAPEGPPPNHVS